jgi:transposase
MNQEYLFEPIPKHRLEMFSKKELIEFIDVQERVNKAFQRDNDRLRNLYEETKQRTLLVEEQYITIKNKLFGKSSEKEPSNEDQEKSNKGKVKKTRVQLPSLRYPDAPLIEREIELKDLPSCSCCGSQMNDSGMTENSEFLTVIPAQYLVIRQKKHKYRCGKCHGDIVTAPAPKRISSGSFSDEIIEDVALTKYCDLIPIERYASIAGRAGLENLAPQSLIGLTHQLAKFLRGAYDRLGEEILEAKVINADETPHRMLEGDKKDSWYLWGFSTPKTSYFECHDTRSGDVASEILKRSKCEFLVSDVFSGYAKAVRETNEYRKINESQLAAVVNVYCNAHARRKFKESKETCPDDSQYFIDKYKRIYKFERRAKGKPPDEVLSIRKKMIPIFKAMKSRAMRNLKAYSSKSSIGKGMSYFLKNYEALTLFVKIPILPIDNNSQESQLRNPVIGRKTWYGTHSKRGAETAAILFSLVESCKLNKINPREYFKKLVQDIHLGQAPYTPKEFAAR